MKKIRLISIILSILLALILGVNFVFDWQNSKKYLANQALQTIEQSPSPSITSSPLPSPITANAWPDFTQILTIKETALIENVPFTPQAPFGNWSDPYSDACEEATIIMAIRWVRNQQLTAEEANREILALVDKENQIFGFHKDTSIGLTANLLTNFYNYSNIELRQGDFRDFGLSDIKKELSVGNLVIIPASGRILKNPFFKHPGPLYHMLVIKGYDDKNSEFTVNDPGTKRGENFKYSYDNILEAWMDWDDQIKDMVSGRRGMLIIKK